MVVKGFRFGLMLQFSIGPVCLLVFNTSSSCGIMTGLVLVIAAALVDAAYIALAGTGVAAILNHSKIKKAVEILGCVILVSFGADTILSAFHKALLPSLQLFSSVKTGNIFLEGILVTASNPLTIVFWSGVFSTEAIGKKMNKRQICLFGSGCVLSTVVFLSVVAAAGCIVHDFLTASVIAGLNIAVGCFLIVFGIKLVIQNNKT